jgi:hypothetical protein
MAVTEGCQRRGAGRYSFLLNSHDEGDIMGRPATGETRVMGFRPPEALRTEFEQLAKAERRTPSDALIEAMHDWVAKRRRGQRAQDTDSA